MGLFQFLTICDILSGKGRAEATYLASVLLFFVVGLLLPFTVYLRGRRAPGGAAPSIALSSRTVKGKVPTRGPQPAKPPSWKQTPEGKGLSIRNFPAEKKVTKNVENQ